MKLKLRLRNHTLYYQIDMMFIQMCLNLLNFNHWKGKERMIFMPHSKKKKEKERRGMISNEIDAIKRNLKSQIHKKS